MARYSGESTSEPGQLAQRHPRPDEGLHATCSALLNHVASYNTRIQAVNLTASNPRQQPSAEDTRRALFGWALQRTRAIRRQGHRDPPERPYYEPQPRQSTSSTSEPTSGAETQPWHPPDTARAQATALGILLDSAKVRSMASTVLGSQGVCVRLPEATQWGQEIPVTLRTLTHAPQHTAQAVKASAASQAALSVDAVASLEHGHRLQQVAECLAVSENVRRQAEAVLHRD